MAKASYKIVGNYKIDIGNKVIVAEMENLSRSEKDIIQMYISAGYLLKEKKKGLTYEQMEKRLKAYPDALKELKKKIDAKENYLQIKKWYKSQIESK